MPTYYSTGVSATLSTCDLQPTLSRNVSNPRQGSGRKANDARIQQAFSGANRLPERPLGADSIAQFIGIHEDMPFYIVEASKNITDRTMTDTSIEEQDAPEEAAVEQVYRLPVLSDDSPLTSLGATPTTPTRPWFSDALFKQPSPVQLTIEALESPAKEQSLQDQVEATRIPSTLPNAHALVLDVQFTDKSFLPEEKKSRNGKRIVGKDLKIEVFVNGQLAEVSIINAGERRRTAAQVAGDRARFSGIRIHRQVEKPWIYAQDAFKPDELPDANDAERRWNMVSSCYFIEAEMRGRNRFGDMPPSAEFLTALAGQEFPRRIAGRQRLGIIDVVITAGSGRKYGPETSYLMKPTRMDDRMYVQQPQSHLSEDIRSTVPSLQRGATRIDFIPPGMASIDRNFSTALNVLSAIPKKSVDSTENIISAIDASYMTSGNSRERVAKSDVKNTNTADSDGEATTLEDGHGSGMPSVKKLKLNPTGDGEVLNAFSTTAGLKATAGPTSSSTQTPQLLQDTDPEAVITQNRIDMALSEGANSNGPLLRRIASMSPQRTPKRKTKASALAGSPTCTPVKASIFKKASSSTHSRKKVQFDDSLVSNPTITASAATNASPLADGITTTALKTKVTEQSVSQALKVFTVPDSCKGSCVSYDEDENVSRLIGKVRGGEFKEETFFAGMRFVVD